MTPEDRGHVAAMNLSLRHRGPDGEGLHTADQVHFAMRRLAIIDLQGGWQPLYNEDKTIALVANGEVYNYIELRRELESKGHRFRTGSDCECIAHAYEEWGLECLHRFRGMYAFALHDTRQRRVVLARDRMGEKPLYLHESEGRVWFASEMRSLMASGRIPFTIDPGAVSLYYHYLFVPEPRTPIVGIRKLEAGHVLTIDLDAWRVEDRCYWRLEDAPPVEGDPARLIREELERIAELTTRSDVPVGVALSAGIDSSAVAALAARARPGQVHALTVGYPGMPRQDERPLARRWAKQLNMPHHEIEVPTREVVELFPERSFWRDDPIADTAGHSYFAVSRLAREKGIPVLLQGQGGDELFWGYGWVRQAAELSRVKAAGKLDTFGARLRRLRGHLPHGLSNGSLRSWAFQHIGYLYGCQHFNPDEGEPADRLVFYNLATEYQRGRFGLPRVFTGSFLEQASGTDPGAVFTLPRPWPDVGVTITALLTRLYLRENGMVQGDRLSMVNSVELRLPLSDYRLAELAVGLRKHAPDDHLPAKHHLKAAVADLLPEWVLNRPKTGFTPPAKLWSEALVDAYRHSLRGGFLESNGIISDQAVGNFQRAHPRYSPWGDLFYRTLVLEFWCRGMEAITGVQRWRLQRIPHVA